MNKVAATQAQTSGRVVLIGLLIGFLLNLTGWIGNNFILGSLWDEVGSSLTHVPWRDTLWSEFFSLLPDFLYGIAIAWLLAKLASCNDSIPITALQTGFFVSLVGGVTTYFAIANSGFIPWNLALASFVLVFATKLPLSFLAAYLLLGYRSS